MSYISNKKGQLVYELCNQGLSPRKIAEKAQINLLTAKKYKKRFASVNPETGENFSSYQEWSDLSKKESTKNRLKSLSASLAYDAKMILEKNEIPSVGEMKCEAKVWKVRSYDREHNPYHTYYSFSLAHLLLKDKPILSNGSYNLEELALFVTNQIAELYKEKRIEIFIETLTTIPSLIAHDPLNSSDYSSPLDAQEFCAFRNELRSKWIELFGYSVP